MANDRLTQAYKMPAPCCKVETNPGYNLFPSTQTQLVSSQDHSLTELSSPALTCVLHPLLLRVLPQYITFHKNPISDSISRDFNLSRRHCWSRKVGENNRKEFQVVDQNEGQNNWGQMFFHCPLNHSEMLSASIM